MTPEDLNELQRQFRDGELVHDSPLYRAFRAAIVRWLDQEVDRRVEKAVKGHAELQKRADALQIAYDTLVASLKK
jgi:hypothetical protein